MKSTNQDVLLAEVTGRLVAEFAPEQIWLFGSHAWGTPRADSDLDLLVIVPHSDERATRRMQRAHRCLSGMALSKDVFVHTRSEFERDKALPSSLQHQVITRGRKLYG